MLLIGACTPAVTPNLDKEKILISDINHKIHELSYANSKYTLIHFWSTWCTACTHELQTLNNFSQYFNSNEIRIVSIALDSEAERIKAIQEKYHLQGDFWMDFQDQAKHAFGVSDVPQTFLVDRQGNLLEFLEPDSGKLVKDASGPQAWDNKKVIDYFNDLVRNR